ncbi:MAG: substrate-binding domain-containing protein [Actinobacteria bacterium]|nr:substrate-binding domain-containing protein [Actinomycetota bacterium]
MAAEKPSPSVGATAASSPSATGGAPAPPPRAATMRDVALAAGVSQATVSNAYTGSGRLSPGRREHVFAVARELGYPGPSGAGRSLRTGRSGAVGVMVTDALTFALEDAAAVELLRGIAAVGEAREVALTLLPFPVGVDEAAAVAASIRRGVVDGFLVWSMPDGHPAVEAAAARREPMVLIDGPRLDGVPLVGVDDEAAAREAAAVVLAGGPGGRPRVATLATGGAGGRRRVVVLVDRLSPDGHAGRVDAARLREARDQVARERVAGFLAACDAAGAAATVIEAGGFSPRDFRTAASAALEIDDLDAIFAATDAVALAALAELSERGIDVPGQVAVLGFDGTAEAARVGLSTVDQPLVEKGSHAMRMLLAAIEHEAPESLLLPTRLELRATT